MKNISDKDFNLIEDFVSGNLTPNEEELFKEKLKNDEVLSKAYAFRTKMENYWNESDTYEKTKKQVSETLRVAHKKKMSMPAFFYAAASIIILIGVTVFYFQQQKEGSAINALSESPIDTSIKYNSGIQLNEQPVKGSLYHKVKVYHINDTLSISIKNIPARSEKVIILNQSENLTVKEITIPSTSDSLLIPLSNLTTGKYKWVIEKSDISGEFVIIDVTE